jgi:hypothetical protein
MTTATRIARAMRHLSPAQLSDLQRFAAGESLDAEGSGDRLRQTVGMLVLHALVEGDCSLVDAAERVRAWLAVSAELRGSTLQDLVVGAMRGA